MELREVVRRRRMVRRFDPRPLPAEVLDRILHSATRAPSAGFSQGLDLLVLEGPEAVRGFWRATADPRFATPYSTAEPPVIVLVLSDKQAYLDRYAELGYVQVDPPGGPKEYLHRAGRTARAGVTGTVVTFALPHQRHELGRLTTQAGVRPVMLSAIPGDRALAAATGARRASGNAISDAAYQRVIAPPPARVAMRRRRLARPAPRLRRDDRRR
jgi:nitroreductase